MQRNKIESTGQLTDDYKNVGTFQWHPIKAISCKSTFI